MSPTRMLALGGRGKGGDSNVSEVQKELEYLRLEVAAGRLVRSDAGYCAVYGGISVIIAPKISSEAIDLSSSLYTLYIPPSDFQKKNGKREDPTQDPIGLRKHMWYVRI